MTARSTLSALPEEADEVGEVTSSPNPHDARQDAGVAAPSQPQPSPSQPSRLRYLILERSLDAFAGLLALPYVLCAFALARLQAATRWARYAREAPLDLGGRLALVTGGSLGIGEACAKGLARQGCAVVLFGRDLDNLRRVQLDIRDLGANCYYYSVDISKREDLYTACDMMVKDVGEPDIVINNAGIGGEMGGLLANDDALLRKVVDTNLMSNFYLTKRFLPPMQARNWGHMMYVSSLAGMRGSAMLNCYATTKAAQISLQESVQCSLDAERSDGVTASVYCVGYVDTPMVQGFRQAFKIKSMLSVEQAAADMVRMVRRREHICFNPAKQAITCCLVAHNPIVPFSIARKGAAKEARVNARRRQHAEAKGEQLGHPLSYRMREVQVQRRMSMFKRASSKKTSDTKRE